MAGIITGAGTALQLSISSVFTNVANIRSIGGPQITVADIDTTILLSTTFFKDFIAGFADGGVVQLEAYMDGLQLQTLYNTLRLTEAWRIVFVDGAQWNFFGHINAISTDAQIEEAVSMPFSIRVKGKPLFSP